MKDLGELNYYLGMKVTRTADYIQLDQTRYTLDILKKYDYLLNEYKNKNYATPMEKDLKLRKSEADSMSGQHADYVERFPYQNIVGALLYLSINTRPDISYSVGVLARFSILERARQYCECLSTCEGLRKSEFDILATT